MKTRIAGTIALIAAAITMNSVYAEQAQCNKDQKQGKAAKTQKTENRTFVKQQKQENTGHRQQQQGENKAFKDSLQGKSKAEQKTMIEQHRNQQVSENKDYRSQQQTERSTFTKTQRDEAVQKIQNSKMSDVDKAAKIKDLEAQWAKDDAFRSQQQQENKAAIEQATADGKVTKSERGDLKENFQTQHKENHEYRKEKNSAQVEALKTE
jgi:hypothetical protein